jgi:hypothetical protein
LALIPNLWITISFWFAASTWQRAAIASTGSKRSVSYDRGAKNDSQPMPFDNSVGHDYDAQRREDETANPFEGEHSVHGNA